MAFQKKKIPFVVYVFVSLLFKAEFKTLNKQQGAPRSESGSQGQLLNQAYGIQTYIRTCGRPGKVIGRSLCAKNAPFDKKRVYLKKQNIIDGMRSELSLITEMFLAQG